MHKPAVIIPAFRRDKSLSRLLTTINEAHYSEKNIELIISLDYGATDLVKETANSFTFKHGRVHVIEHGKKLGLKDHIIKCADFSLEYGSAIVLEEDLIVSPGFYQFAQNALNFYRNEDSVAGVALYSQRFNETAQLPFEPIQSDYSVYFMKLVCSWGQAWTATQWKDFKEWYSGIDSRNFNFEEINDLPENIKKWSNSSWKKFFNTYLLNKEKYFLYPYSSFSTHSGDEEGEHITDFGNLFQVPLSYTSSENQNNRFPEFKNHSIKYDLHMEASGEFVNSFLKLDSNNIAVDFYGSKNRKQLCNSDYVLSSKKYKKPIRSFPLQFKPLELNMKFESYNGDPPFFYLYKTDDIIASKFKKPNHLRFAKYFSYQNFFSGTIFRSLIRNIFKS